MSYFVLGNVYWTFNLLAVFCLFETLKMFYPPKGLYKADTEGGPIVFTHVLFCVWKPILDFQFTDGFLPFWDLGNVYPPKGFCKADTEGGPIVFTYVLFCVRKRILDFQFTGGFLPFWDLKNGLSPGGTLKSRARKGSNCFYLFYFGLGNVYRTFNLLAVFCLFETLNFFLLCGLFFKITL